MRRSNGRRRALQFACVGLIFALISAQTVLAAETDQPIHIDADKAGFDQQRGISTYRGNVYLRQGGMELRAAVLTVHQQEGEVQKIIAEGKPVRFLQRQQASAEEIRATAAHMEYQAASGELLLQGAAELRQGGDVLRSQRIVYDTVRKQAEAGSADERVHITLQPRRPAAPDDP